MCKFIYELDNSISILKDMAFGGFSETKLWIKQNKNSLYINVENNLKANLKLRLYKSIVLQKYQNKNLRSIFLNSYKDLGMVLFL